MNRFWLVVALLGASGCMTKRVLSSGEGITTYKLMGTYNRVERGIEDVCDVWDPREVKVLRSQGPAPTTTMMTTTSTSVQGNYLVTTTSQTPLTLTSVGWLHVDVTCEEGYEGETDWQYSWEQVEEE